jgi:hypothetical protein
LRTASAWSCILKADGLEEVSCGKCGSVIENSYLVADSFALGLETTGRCNENAKAQDWTGHVS